MQSAQGRSEDLRNERRQARRRRKNRVYNRRYRRRLKAAGRVAKTVATRFEDGGAPIATYADLVAYLVARRKALGLTQEEVDERAGFTARYCSKLEAWTGPQGRVAGSISLPLWLEALGVRLKPLADAPADIKRPRLNGADLARRVPPQ